MRYLGAAADAASEVATYDQLPAGGGGGLFATVASNFSYGTTATDITDLTLALAVGTYAWRAFESYAENAAMISTKRMNFSGSASGTWHAAWQNASALTMFQGRAYNADLAFASSISGAVESFGTIVVTVAGNLVTNYKRASGTSGLIHAGSYIEAVKVA